MDTAWDDEVGYIYTYVTVVAEEWIKGAREAEIVIKQLGGRVGDLEMVVYDQAEFRLGEDVLLFLSQRPRDRTLQTTGLWQGKWTIRDDPSGGGRVAYRSPFRRGEAAVMPDAESHDDVRLMEPFTAELEAWVGDGMRRDRGRDTQPNADTHPVMGDASAAVIEDVAGAFTLLGSGARWHQADNDAPVLVDLQAGGEPGLPGSGGAEVADARSLWSAAGGSLNLSDGVANRGQGFTAAQLCSDTSNIDGRLALYFDDPCAEIANNGTLAIGGFWSSGSDVRNVNGTNFRGIVKGYVIFSDESNVQAWLNTSTCFQDVATHELGHAVGLGHSSSRDAIMYPSINNACFNAPDGAVLGSDDVSGLRFIYPSTASTPAPLTVPSSPNGAIATVVVSMQVELTWADTSADELGFKVQRRTPGGFWKTAAWLPPNATRYVDTGLSAGTYCYRLRSYNEAGSSPYLGTTPGCVDLDRPTAPSLVFALVTSASSITVSWVDNSAGELGFKVQRRVSTSSAWTTVAWAPANASSFVDDGLGSASYCYRVRSYSTLGNSAYVQSLPLCVSAGGRPAAPSAVSAAAVSTTAIGVSWSDNSNNELGFKIQRRYSSGSTWTTVAFVASGAATFRDSGLSAGSYCYRVRSYNSSGSSSYVYSSPTCVTVGVSGSG